MTAFNSMKFRLGPMKPGEFLLPNESLISDNRVFELRYQTNGDLALYSWSSSGKIFLWHSNTPGTALGRVEFTKAGQLAVIGPKGEIFWSSPAVSAGRDPALSLHLQTDGNLATYSRPSYETVILPRHCYWASNTWARFNAYALLIGVEDYSAFDATGAKNLLAGRNDVLAMWKVCRRMGYNPENIHVCTSPVLTPAQIVEVEIDLELSNEKYAGEMRNAVKTPQGMDELRAKIRDTVVKTTLIAMRWPQVLCPADSASIENQVNWLSTQLGQPFRDGKGYLVPGILYYSGHGARVNAQLALCPSNATQMPNGALNNVLKFASIEATLSKDDQNRGDDTSPLQYLTVLLDCCTAGAADGAQSDTRANPLIVDTSATSMEDVNAALQAARESKLGRRTFCGSRADEQGQQALLDGRWRGAFTWAFCRAVEQWKVGAGSGLFAYSDVSHMELVFRTRMQLEALGFAQTPVLLDSIGNMPVFWSGVDRVDKGQKLFPDDPWILNFMGKPMTVTNPNTARDGIQLDPTLKTGYTMYTFTLSYTDATKPLTAWVLSAADNSPDGAWRANTEYWNVPAEFSGAWNNTQYKNKQLTVTASSSAWSSLRHSYQFTRSAAMAASQWTQPGSAPPATTLWSNNVGINFPTASSVNWYAASTEAPTDTYFLSPTNLKTFAVAAPSGTKWVL